MNLNTLVSFISILISLLAVLITYLAYKGQKQEQSYADIDAMYFEILKLSLDYPDLRNPEKTRVYWEDPDSNSRLRYESYAYMTWNFLESIFDRQKSPSGELKISKTWTPVLLEESKLHNAWFLKNKRFFKQAFYDFVVHTLKKIDITVSSNFSLVEDLYSRSFPVEERKTKESVQKLLNNNTYHLVIGHNKFYDQTVGFALYYASKEKPTFFLIDYMAIDPIFQNGGYGQQLFQTIKNRLSSDALGIFLEIERPDLAANEKERINRQRRQTFYERMDCHVLDIDYHLPTPEFPLGLPMSLMFCPNKGTTLLPADRLRSVIWEMYKQLHGEIPDLEAVFEQFQGKIPVHHLSGD